MCGDRPNVQVFYGRDVEDVTERRFLRRTRTELEALGLDAVILANSSVGPKRRQVDFVVATPHVAVVVEVKGYKHTVHGAANGPWRLDLGDGGTRVLGATNPYNQALDCRYAVTDEFVRHSGTSGEPAKSAVLGCLCIHPVPPHGSNLPASDHKVAIGGFPEFLALLSHRPATAIPLRAWRDFALALGLEAGQVQESGADAVAVEDYLAAFKDLRRAVAGPFVEPAKPGGATGLEELAGRVAAGAQLHLIGPSGSGKTELLWRLADRAAERGLLPVVVRAGAFTGKLAPLLREAVAKATAVSLPALMGAVNRLGREAVVFVDGTNECQERLQPELAAALQAARLRFDVRVVTAGQSLPPLPATLAGDVVQLCQPDAEHARRLVEAHLGRPLSDAAEQDALEIVATAHDASVLASVIRHPAALDGRHSLYAAFTEGCMGPSGGRAVHEALGSLAGHMREGFMAALPRPAASRMLAGAGGPDAEATALRSGLVVEEGRLVRFRHDLIADFYAADRVLKGSGGLAPVASAARPLNAELREFILGGCATVTEIEAVLAACPTQVLLKASLRGRCGRKARDFVLDRCRDLIAELSERYTRLRLELPENFGGPARFHAFAISFEEGTASDDRGDAYLALIPFALEEGLLPDALDLFGRVDARIREEARRLKTNHPGVRLMWEATGYGSVYGLPLSAQGHELRALLSGARMLCLDRGRRMPDLGARVREALGNFENHSPGQLFLLLTIFRASNVDQPPARLNALLEHVWTLRIYHLRLTAFDVVQFHGRALPEAERDEVRRTLEGWLSNGNPLMNAIIVDALESVGGLDPTLGVEDAVREYEGLLALPSSLEAAELCMNGVMHTWDHPFAGVYWEAFYDRLAPEKRRAVLVRALGSGTSDAMLLSGVVRSLFDAPSVDAVPRLQELAEGPHPRSLSHQEAVHVYAAAIALLAKMGVAVKARTEDGLGPAELAWCRAAPLVHAFNEDVPSTSDKLWTTLWGAMEGCGAGAVIDVVRHLENVGSGYDRCVKIAFLETCSTGLLAVCRRALSPGYVPISVFEQHGSRDLEAEHIAFALRVLGAIGRKSDLALIRTWIDDRAHGEAAVAAARLIERR